MGVGVLTSMLFFIYDYAKVPVVQRTCVRSNVIRSLPLSSKLDALLPTIITLRCSGYIFFGSTLQASSARDACTPACVPHTCARACVQMARDLTSAGSHPSCRCCRSWLT